MPHAPPTVYPNTTYTHFNSLLMCVGCPRTCHSQALCASGKCTCLPPLTGDGITHCFNCSTCHAMAECRPKENRCTCRAGFVGNGITCVVAQKGKFVPKHVMSIYLLVSTCWHILSMVHGHEARHSCVTTFSSKELLSLIWSFI